MSRRRSETDRGAESKRPDCSGELAEGSEAKKVLEADKFYNFSSRDFMSAGRSEVKKSFFFVLGCVKPSSLA